MMQPGVDREIGVVLGLTVCALISTYKRTTRLTALFIEHQILVPDYWSRWMTAFVAVSLTLITPYIFKISSSFLVWVFGGLGAIAATWSDINRAMLITPSPEPTESRNLLSPTGVANYGATQSFNRKDGIQSSSNDQSNGNASTDYAASSHASLVSAQVSSKGKARQDQSIEDPPDPSKAPVVAAASPPTSGPSRASGRDTDPGDHPATSHTQHSPVTVLKDSLSNREVIWHYIRRGLQGGAKECNSPSKTSIVIATILFGLFIAQAVAGVFSAKIASDRAGLSSSQHCGTWEFDESAGDDADFRANLLNNYHKEARASQYARTCYQSPSTTSLSCGLFYNQSIAFKTFKNQPCPFASSELCLHGLYSAITFDTGIVDASVIGINAKDTHKFRRKTSCSPLNMTEPYVKNAASDKNDTYQYYYGSKQGSTEYTFSTSGHPFQWLAPVYSVK